MEYKRNILAETFAMPLKFKLFKFTVLAIVSLTAVFVVLGQGNLGTVSGVVTDSNGDAIVGATVTVTDLDKGTKRSTTTNESGIYVIPNLVVGNYSVIASASGFQEKKVGNIRVSVAATNPVRIILSATGVTGVVNITAGDESLTVNTNDQQLSTLIDNKKILDLPLLSRNPNTLVLLAPGVTTSNGGQGGVSVNGQRERNNNFLLDGVDNNDASVPGFLGGQATPSIDATEEFRVITSNFLPEYGRNSGAIITVATKGGTNEFHGGAYIFYRSDAFDARNFFDGANPSPLQRRQYGASIGGPIHFLNFGEGVPAHYDGEDRSFFFFNIERDLDDRGFTRSRTVPSAQARQGIFDLSSLGLGVIDARPGSQNNVVNSLIGLPGDRNIIPSLQAFLDQYPLGNSPGQGSLPGVFDTFNFGTQTNNKSFQLSTRIDHKFNDSHSIRGSFTYTDGEFEFCCETFPGLDDSIKSPQTGWNYTTSFSSAFGTNLFNEFRLGLNESDTFFTGAGDAGVSTTAADAALNAINGAGSAVIDFSGANGSYINFAPSGLTSLASFSTQGGLRATNSLSDFVTVLSGNHQFRFGGEARFVKSTGPTNFGRQESLTFSVPTTFGFPILADNQGNLLSTSGILGTVQNFASYLYGFVANQSQSQYFDGAGNRRADDSRKFRQNEFDVFFQDTWKIRPNLTLNYGTRWEFKGVPYETSGLLSNLVDHDPSGATPAGGFEFHILQGNDLLYNNDWDNWAPRVGFAYSPNFGGGFLHTLFGDSGQTSIRGGYGIFYDRIFGNLFGNARGNAPFQQDLSAFVGTYIENISRPTDLTSSRFVTDGTFAFPVLFPLPGNNTFQSKFETPYTQSWNIGIQRQFTSSVLMEVNYVGTRAVHQIRVVDGNRVSVDRVNALTGSTNTINPFSGFTNFLNGSLNTAFFNSALNATVGNAVYHAGQFKVTKRLDSSRFGDGQFQAFYTWSHSIDDATDPISSQNGERSFPRDSSGFVGGLLAERGDSGFDARHNFVFNGVYDLPFSSSNAFVNQVVSGFTVTGIFRFVSGRPFSAFSSTDSSGTGFSNRADYVGAGNGLTATTGLDTRTQTGPTRDFFLNPLPNADGTGRRGTSGRSAFRGPNFSTLDMSIIKRFKFGGEGRYVFSIRADAFNVLNTVNLGSPSNNINSANFGQSTTAGAPRRFQFAGRFDF